VGYDFGVGREAPTFTLNAADGSEIRLSQYRGDWFPVLVFVPSTAPGAADALGELSSAAAAVWGLRGQVVGVCDASRDECAALAARVPGLAFPLLADDGAVARMYGALRDDGTVRPMAFIIDRAGKIVWTGEGAAALTEEALLAAFRQVVR
jgi:peroxiredoxin Q/BCP